MTSYAANPMAYQKGVIRRKFEPFAQFIRLSLLGVTIVLVLLGAASAGNGRSFSELSLLVVVAILVHSAVYILNDVVDLPLDLKVARRSTSPLVRGVISKSSATIVALLSGGTAVAICSSNRIDTLLVVVSLGCLSVYNVLGKRFRYPPATDFIQGIGWAALVLLGAAYVSRATISTWYIAAFVAVYVTEVNGVHGALRDIFTDFPHGSRTTAIWLGARPGPDGQVHVPTALLGYSLALHAIQSCILLLGMRVALTSTLTRITSAGLEATAGVALGLLLFRGLVKLDGSVRSWALGFIYIVAELPLALPLALGRTSLSLLLCCFAVYLVPWLSGWWIQMVLRRIRRHRNFPSG